MEVYSPVHRTRDQTRSLRVLYAGRLLAPKGLDTFIQAAKSVQLQAQDLDVEMLVAGSHTGDPDEVPLSYLENAPGICLLGHVDKMSELLSSCDVVVLPSRYNEGIPRILLEGAASGCAPIATAFPGSRAIIDHEQTGFFLADGHMEEQATELANLLVRLARNRQMCSSIGEEAARSIRKRGYDKNTIIKAFLSLYHLSTTELQEGPAIDR